MLFRLGLINLWNMKREIIILSIAAVFLIAFGVSVYFNIKHGAERSYWESQVKSLRIARDSVSDYNIMKARAESYFYLNRADSLQTYIQVYHTADSLNQYKNRHEKAKIPFLGSGAIDRLRDSILSSRGYHRTR